MAGVTFGTPRVTAPDPNYETIHSDLRQQALEASTAVVQGVQRKWFRPSAAAVDFGDRESFGKPFDRSALNGQLVAALSDPQSPGTTSDTVAGQTMVEALALLEREFLTRHTLARIRAEAACASRFTGHAKATGPLTQNTVEYVRQVIAGGTETV